jgi:hypothetical protein
MCFVGHSPPPWTQVRILATMRRRLGLPALAPNTEPAPGAHGLRTPGYYIVALHFRRIPLGFEPLSGALPIMTTFDFILSKFVFERNTRAKFESSVCDTRNQKCEVYISQILDFCLHLISFCFSYRHCSTPRSHPVMLNEPQHKDWRIGQLAGFWEGNRARLAHAAKVCAHTLSFTVVRRNIAKSCE